jgi:tetratricopeptide (TPR) repeat protein
MATVYVARDLKHDREVAIKVLRPDLAEAVGERFLQEIHIEAQLQHPHICPLYDSGQAAGTLYYVMPYVEGETLRQRLDREGPLPLDESLKIAREVAEALDHAHGVGVVHRDVKPENVLLSSGHAMLADFGIARAIQVAGGSRLTETGIVIGTPYYMSPEQGGATGRLDGRSDLYSLGCVLYEMLAGEPPFTGRNAQTVVARHMQERIPSLEVVRPNLPPGVVIAIERALAKVPADRYSTALEFVDALETPVEPRREGFPWRPTALVGVTVSAAIVGWLILFAPAADLDPNKVTVFPLAERGLRPTALGAGYDVALTIGAALEHTEPLKWIDGAGRLPTELRRDISQLTPTDARQISRERGAAYYIDGVAWSGSDSSRVVLRLNDVVGDSVVVQETATASVGEIPWYQLGLSAVRGLLPPLVDPGREIDLTPISDRDPAAIALWIQGERSYRRSQFLEALDFYRRAVAEDSALSLAALKGAQAASWENRLEEAEHLIAVALRSESHLPRRYRHLAHGLRAYLTGNADSAVSRLELAVLEEPEWAEPYVALGEVFYHLLPSGHAPLDSLAEAAFEAALAIDSGFALPLFHLTEISLRRGDLAAVEEHLVLLTHFEPPPRLWRQLLFMRGCMQEGPENADWQSAVTEDPSAALNAALALSVAAAQPECAELGYRAVLGTDDDAGRLWGALYGLQGLLASEGRSTELRALADSAIREGTRRAQAFYIIDALAGVDLREEAHEIISGLQERLGDTYEALQTPATLWLFGAWHALNGDIAIVVRLQERLALQARETGDRAASLFAQALDAHLALLRGDTTETIQRLASLTPNGRRADLDWDFAEPLPVERLRLSELLLARGRFEDAIDAASTFDHPTPVVYVPFVAKSLGIRYRAAVALGRSRSAAQYRDRLARLGRLDLVQ